MYQTIRLNVLAFSFFLLIASLSCSQNNRDGITRAEFVAMISDYFDWPHPEQYNDIWKVPIDGFDDVSSADPYGRQIEVALEQGIIKKDASGNFNPDAVITREEAAAILEAAFMLGDLVEGGYMEEGGTDDILSGEEAVTLFDAITSSVVAPVQAVPVTTAVAPRRYIKLWCPTEGATIYFTRDGSEPDMDSEVYDIGQMGHIMEMIGSRGGGGADQDTREVVYRAFAVKDGMENSPVRKMVWNMYRPLEDDFQSDLIVEGDATTPKVYRVYNDAETVRAMCWFIEGPERGIVYDALQTPVDDRHNLKEYIDRLATKPYILVIGHDHGDHDAQLPSFLDAGIEVYANDRGWASIGRQGGFGAVVPDPEKQKLVNNVDEGDSFDLGGGCLFEVYAMPGHANSNITINDKQSGMVFGSDNICTRAGSADNTGVSGLKADLMLSFTQQAISNFTRGGAVVNMLFTGHDEQMLSYNNLLIFEQAFQQVVDNGEDGCSLSLRGGGRRVTTVGDMWKDGTDWVSLGIGGNLGDDYEYLTSNATANYNAGGHTRYSVLSNIEIDGGDLVGTTVAWADPRTFEWAGEEITVPNALPDKFDPWTFDYTIQVPAASSHITIAPTTMSTKVTEIRLNGDPVEYRSVNEVEITGNGQVIEITVVAPDGETTSSYSFTIELT